MTFGGMENIVNIGGKLSENLTIRFDTFVIIDEPVETAQNSRTKIGKTGRTSIFNKQVLVVNKREKELAPHVVYLFRNITR